MKVLFVGEGDHDIGPQEHGAGPRTARGVVPTLSRKVVPSIDEGCKALAWRELPRFEASARKKGFAAKVAAAVLVSSRRFDCEATVCVADRDRDAGRLALMAEGKDRARQLVGDSHRIACGVAIESVEAWTLGAREAIAEELGLEPEAVRNEYPKADVESLHEKSGRPKHRPKALLEQIAQLKGRSDSSEFREAVAARTDVDALMKACPQGFKPFAEELRTAFSPDGEEQGTSS